MRRWVGLLGTLTVLLLPVRASAQSIPALVDHQVEEGVTVMLLANEGFLLRGPEGGVLIDAFLAESFSGYDAVPAPLLQAMQEGKPPFDTVTLALASHAHRDHIQAEVAAAFLEARPDVRFVSSPQVVELVREELPEDLEVRVEETLPDAGSKRTVQEGGIQVEVLRLRHGSSDNYSMHNLGHIITLGGKRFLHVGDAEMLASHFAAYSELLTTVDVAFIPYWFFGMPGGREIVEQYLPGVKLIPCHIPSHQSRERIHEQASAVGDVWVPLGPMDAGTF